MAINKLIVLYSNVIYTIIRRYGEIMKIMSFNIKNDTIFTIGKKRWPFRYAAINDIIKQEDPDIIGMQEVTNKMLADLDLNNYAYVGSSRNRFFDLANEKNIILYKKSDFKILNSKTIWLSSSPEKLGSRTLGSIYPRICTYISLQDKNYQIYNIYNTHLDHLFGFVRHAQINHLQDFINNDQKIPFVIMGDFNTTIRSKYIQQLITELKLNNCYQFCDQILSTHIGLFSSINKHPLPIDYIFTSKELTINNTVILNNKINNKYASDHSPIICNIMP